MEDTELINQVLAGDESAYTTLYKKYSGKVLGFAMKRLSNKNDAEELVQRTFVKAFLKLNTVRDKEKLQSWLFTIYKNNETDFFRERKFTEDITKVKIEEFDDLEFGIKKSDLPVFAQKRLEKFGCNIDTFDDFEVLLLNKIGEKCKKLIRLRHLESISYKEIAKIFYSKHTGKQLKDQLYECMKKARKFFNQ